MSLLMQALKKAEHAKQKQGSFAGEDESSTITEEALSLTPMELPKEFEIAEQKKDVQQEIDSRIDSGSLNLAPHSAALDIAPEKIEAMQEPMHNAPAQQANIETKNLHQNQSNFSEPAADHAPGQHSANAMHEKTARLDATAKIAHETPSISAPTPAKLKIGTEQQQAEIKIAHEQQKAKAIFASKQAPGGRRTWAMFMAITTVLVMLAAFGFLYWQNTMSSANGTFNKVSTQAVLPSQPASVTPAESATGQSTPITPAQIQIQTPSVTQSKTDQPATAQTSEKKIESQSNAAPLVASQKTAETVSALEPEIRKPVPTKRSGIATMTAEAQAIKVLASTSSNQLNPSLTGAYQAFIAGDMELAKQQYEKVLVQEPNNRDALLGLGAIAIAQKHANEASAFYLKLLEADPADTDAIAGLTSMQYGDVEQSESRLKKIVAQNPNASPILFVLGNLYSRQARWSDAQQSYFRAYGSAPDNADYSYNLAVSLDRLGQSKLALDFYQKAISLVKGNQGNFNKTAIQKRINELSAAAGK